MPENGSAYKAGYVAIVGGPNVGKSTLLNALLQQKISIVARKPQTTRQRVPGILTTDDSQIIFIDTPGFLRPRYLLHEKMMKQLGLALSEADVTLAMTDVLREAELDPELRTQIVERRRGRPVFLVINKVDNVQKPTLLPLIAKAAQAKIFDEIIPISALRGQNLDALLKAIRQYLPNHPAFYPAETVSDKPERFFVAELIREKIFQQFEDEIPYSTAVEIQEFKERESGGAYINADILVERDSQKAIIIGREGTALKKVGEAARKEIEEFIQRRVYLSLFVKVRDRWRKDEAILSRLGYTER